MTIKNAKLKIKNWGTAARRERGRPARCGWRPADHIQQLTRRLFLPAFLIFNFAFLNGHAPAQGLPSFSYPFVGATANDGTGTPLRASLGMINTNFTNLYVWLNTNGVLTLTITNDTRALSLTNSGSILWGAFTGVFNGLNTNSVVLNGGSSTPSIALLAANATPATNSVQQAPGALELSGQGYQTGTSHSRETDLRLRELPVQGGPPGNEPGVQWLFDSQVDLGGWTNDLTLDWLGNLTIPGGFTNNGPLKLPYVGSVLSVAFLSPDGAGNISASINAGAFTNLTAANLVGYVPDTSLSNNLPRLNSGNVFAGPYQIFNGVLAIPNLIASLVPLGVLGASGQTADLQDWLNSSGVKLAGITAAGVFTGNGSGLSNYLGSLTQPLLAGTLSVSNGVGTYSAQGPVPITATGATNSFGIDAFIYVTCTSVTSWITNAAGVCVKTNLNATYVDQPFHLEPTGCIHAASGLSGQMMP